MCTQVTLLIFKIECDWLLTNCVIMHPTFAQIDLMVNTFEARYLVVLVIKWLVSTFSIIKKWMFEDLAQIETHNKHIFNLCKWIILVLISKWVDFYLKKKKFENCILHEKSICQAWLKEIGYSIKILDWSWGKNLSFLISLWCSIVELYICHQGNLIFYLVVVNFTAVHSSK